jgi:hypothetical protein
MGKWLRPRRTVRRTLVLDKSDVSGEPTKTSIQAANLRARGRRRANPAQFAAHTRIHDSILPDAPSDEIGATDPAVGVRDYVDRPERFPDTPASVWAQTLAQELFRCAVQLLGICKILGLDVQAARDALIARIAMRRRNPSRSSLPGLLIARPRVL